MRNDGSCHSIEARTDKEDRADDAAHQQQTDAGPTVRRMWSKVVATRT